MIIEQNQHIFMYVPHVSTHAKDAYLYPVWLSSPGRFSHLQETIVPSMEEAETWSEGDLEGGS